MGEFRMPSLGSDMEKGTLVEWLKKPGDTVRPGDVVAVIETEKGAIEIEAFEAGTFERSLVDIGQTVPVGTPIAVINGGVRPSAPIAAPAAAVPRQAASAPPMAPRIAGPVEGLKVSPAARKLAAERGIDVTQIRGSGPDGSIVFTDVESYAPGVKPTAQAPIPSAPSKEKRATPPDMGMRSIIAAATARSKREIPHYYLSHEVDITRALKWLAKTNTRRTPDERLLPAVLLLKALARALRKHPGFNGFYEENAFRLSDRIHIGVAIAIRGGGLVAPAIHDTDKLSLDDLMERLRDLVTRVRQGRFRSSEISDPTITLTSLGERGVDTVIPVIYPPQVAILGAGTPRKQPMIADGKVRVRDVITLSLAGDHRASDGHSGALFLVAWANLLQHPEEL
ncbi:MAG: 2-oxo acid dehydrogenase subunit E2 [Alphaproteobacteria bacterium]|nr:2-oxo acid dehydrogenase subunit E2 [Alphaproteobacteria bacterium]